MAEGATIPEAEPELAEAVVHTVKVAKLLRLSREQFFQSRAGGILADAAQRSIVSKADALLLNQAAPVGPATVGDHETETGGEVLETDRGLGKQRCRTVR